MLYESVGNKEVHPTKQDNLSKSSELSQIVDNVYKYRVAVLFCLVCTAFSCGYGSYRLLSDLEYELAEAEFKAIEDNFASGLDKSVSAKVSALQALSHHVGTLCPEAKIWPNCSIPFDSFEYITTKLIDSGDLKAMSFSPLLDESEVPSFESFAYNVFEEEGESTLGIYEFGRGIYTKNASGNNIHDFDARNAKGSRQILVPVFQIGELNDNRRAVMFNIYSETNRATTIDYAISCNGDCVSVTSPVQIVQESKTRPASLMMVPLRPYRSNNTIVGVTVSVFFWDTIVSAGTPSFGTGLYILLEVIDLSESYTYKLDAGKVIYMGPGDRRSGELSEFRCSFHIDEIENINYKITVSASDEFLANYQSWAPVVSCCVAIGIILFTSCVFIFYDKAVATQQKMNTAILSAKRDFVRFVSHEIRTPLNTIHLGVKVLHEELADILSILKKREAKTVLTNKIEQLIDFTLDIDESNDCAVGVLNDLINYDKIVTGALSMKLEEHNVWSLIADAARPLQVHAYKKRINMSLNLQTSHPDLAVDSIEYMKSLVVFADELKIKHVLRSIISNALKFTGEEGKVQISAMCKLLKGNDSITITINDNGVGLSKNDIAKLSEKVISQDTSHLRTGDGKGVTLWICRQIVEMHHGSMSIESDGLGCGSCVTIDLPIVSGRTISFSPQKSRSEISLPKVVEDKLVVQDFGPLGSDDRSDYWSNSVITNINSNLSGGHEVLEFPTISTLTGKKSKRSVVPVSDIRRVDVKKVLVVDDVASTRKIIKRTLIRDGYECDDAVNGEDCLEKVARNSYDLILMDYEMPIMNGPEATSILVKKQKCSIPVVGLTGNSLPKDIEYFKSCGAIEVLVKPLDLPRFKGIIEDINCKRLQLSNEVSV